MGSQLRIGAVAYLNTRPLIHHLPAILPQARLSLDLPSRLAADLVEGRLDVALVPVIECARHSQLVVVSDACIACRGPVLSVKLFLRVPPTEVASIALDEGSRSSAGMVQILFRQQFGKRPRLTSLPLHAGLQDAGDADAVLLIGDRAMHAGEEGFHQVWDLGDVWCRLTELPFVFAVWAAGPGVDLAGLETPLEQARDWGIRDVPEIAQRAAPACGLSPAQIETYLREHLHFCLGPWERRGLRHYLSLARQFGLIPLENELQIHDCPTA